MKIQKKFISMIALFLKYLPVSFLEKIVVKTIYAKLQQLSPMAGMRFLLRLDNEMYSLEGQQSVAYGEGLHTKHQHTKYHDFFINRINSDEKVLDIGCGVGTLAHDVAVYAKAIVFGIDHNSDNIARAIREFSHPNLVFKTGDALKDLPHEKFDVVILSNVLEHLSNRTEFLRKINAIAAPKRILIRVPLFERDWRVPLKKELGIEWRLDKTHQIEYTQDDFLEEMKAAELNINFMDIRWGEIWSEVKADETSN